MSLSTNIIKRGRVLTEQDDVFSQNAWDDAEWTKEMVEEAEERIKQQRLGSSLINNDIDQIEHDVTQKWDTFYEMHQDKFFKDRQWIFSEFPELLATLEASSPPSAIFEVGCGVGNAVVHIINSCHNSNLHIYCCDLANNAIDILKKREVFGGEKGSQITAFQADICKDFDSIICHNIAANSLDFITMIFTLSAIKPELMKGTISKLSTLLKPGGMILFRDYAQYDLTQLRFKAKSYLRDNYYMRSDGTTSYFFTKPMIRDIFSDTFLEEVDLKTDNRILVNRLKSLKMSRCWIQAKYRKRIA